MTAGWLGGPGRYLTTPTCLLVQLNATINLNDWTPAALAQRYGDAEIEVQLGRLFWASAAAAASKTHTRTHTHASCVVRTLLSLLEVLWCPDTKTRAVHGRECGARNYRASLDPV